MKRFTLWLFVAALAVALLGGTAIAQSGKEAAEIEKAERAWGAAVAKQDMGALAGILSDDLIYVHSSGVVESKLEYLEKLKSGAQKYDSVEHLELKTQGFGGSGWAASKVRMRGATNGQPFDNTMRMMHMWVKQKGVWRLAAHQTTRVTQ